MDSIDSTPTSSAALAAGFLHRLDLLKNRRSNNMSYRACFGLENPQKGTKLAIDHDHGIGFFIIWPDCPDGENIIEGWFKTRNEAVKFIKAHGWLY